MFELILMASLIQTSPVPQTAQFQPCVWPNKCNKQIEAVLRPIQTCVWPNVCKTEPVETVAQFQPCVWPNKCNKALRREASHAVEPTIKTCDYPNTCA